MAIGHVVSTMVNFSWKQYAFTFHRISDESATCVAQARPCEELGLATFKIIVEKDAQGSGTTVACAWVLVDPILMKIKLSIRLIMGKAKPVRNVMSAWYVMMNSLLDDLGQLRVVEHTSLIVCAIPFRLKQSRRCKAFN